MLRALGAIIALLVTTGSNGLEFNQQNVNSLSSDNPTDKLTLLNPEVTMEFKSFIGNRKKYVTFMRIREINLGSKRHCDGALGLKGPRRTVCRLQYININVDEQNNEPFVEIFFRQDFSIADPYFQIEVPIMTVSSYGTSNRQQWAQQNDVDVPAWLNNDLLENIRSEALFTLEFGWLQQLLNREFYKHRDMVYRSKRPIVLTEAFLRELTKVIKS